MSRLQKRIVVFVHDGVGLGHLQRVCKLVKVLQGVFSCLVITGMRAASWLVPDRAEFVHIPSLENLIKSRARELGRFPFVRLEEESGIHLRQAITDAALTTFDPDAIIVEYRPLGDKDELEPVLFSSRARKYLLLRGVLDTPANVQEKFLQGPAGHALQACYDRILVASDRRICDLADEYGFPPAVSSKLVYTGYIGTPITPEQQTAARMRRGLNKGVPWIVCSAGGGRPAGALISSFRTLSAQFPNAVFDFVDGPQASQDHWEGGEMDSFVVGNTRYFRECRYLPTLHGSADIVVTHGGYNSLVEAMDGGARLVSCYAPPNHLTNNYIEEWIHPERLSRYYPIQLVTDAKALPEAVARAIACWHRDGRVSARDTLKLDGARTIRKLLLADLAVDPEFERIVSKMSQLDPRAKLSHDQLQELDKL